MPHLASLALAAIASAPCGLPTPEEIERLLGGPAIHVPPTEIGEETAPFCLWATDHRQREIKLEVWSKDDLQVLGLRDADAYYARLKTTEAGVPENLAGAGERAFVSGLKPDAGMMASGRIVIQSRGRLYLFTFTSVRSGSERLFVQHIMHKRPG